MKTHSAFDGVDRKAVCRDAAIATSGGVHYDDRATISQAHWDTPPPMRRPPRIAPKLIGVRFGRFTVVGLHRDVGGSWVVRCDCGAYETRKAKSIRNPNNFGDRCIKCRHLAFLRADYEYRVHGRQVDRRGI